MLLVGDDAVDWLVNNAWWDGIDSDSLTFGGGGVAAGARVGGAGGAGGKDSAVAGAYDWGAAVDEDSDDFTWL